MLKSLRLQNFRIFDDYSIDFTKNVNVIIGPNAIGKTTILEAISLALNGTSFRSSDKNLISVGRDWSRIELDLDDQKRVIKLKSNNNLLNKNFSVLNDEFKRLPSRLKLPIVVFEPDDLRLINGSPERKRKYLDDILSFIDYEYPTHLRNYRRVLDQRNNLLKSENQIDTGDLFSWDILLSRSGVYISKKRREIMKEINKSIAGIYQDISDTDNDVLMLTESKEFNSESRLFEQLQNNIGIDNRRGSTSIGPHKDLFEFKLRDKPTKGHSSRGETRTIVVTLKLIEAKLKETKDNKPIILLDDVLGELDSGRRKKLIEGIKDNQTLITTTDADLILKDFKKTVSIIPLV